MGQFYGGTQAEGLEEEGTRWDGHRKEDCFMTNSPANVSRMEVVQDKVSDHKPIRVSINIGVHRRKVLSQYWHKKQEETTFPGT